MEDGPEHHKKAHGDYARHYGRSPAGAVASLRQLDLSVTCAHPVGELCLHLITLPLEELRLLLDLQILQLQHQIGGLRYGALHGLWVRLTPKRGRYE